MRSAEYILHRTVDHGTRQTVEGGKKCLKHDFGNYSYVGESGATKTKFLLIFFASDDSFNIFVTCVTASSDSDLSFDRKYFSFFAHRNKLNVTNVFVNIKKIIFSRFFLSD